MAHYAFLNDSNIVTEVIPGKDETETIDGLTPEEWYGNFREQKCVRTSYNAKIRGKYATIGDTYDAKKDIFVTPQPFSSWIQDGSFWKAPVEMPVDGKLYRWDEATKSWIEITE
jgi:hypothetical protein